MKPDTYIKFVSDPKHWRKKAVGLRVSAEAVWKEYLSKLTDAIDPETKDICEDKFDDSLQVLTTYQLLYAMATECALKGLLIAEQPEIIQITTVADASGKLLSADIKRQEGFRLQTHDLQTLAKKAGMFNDPEWHDMREPLAYGTDLIMWRGRYPAPLANDVGFNPTGTVNYRAFAHYFGDYFEPFLRRIIERIDQSLSS